MGRKERERDKARKVAAEEEQEQEQHQQHQQQEQQQQPGSGGGHSHQEHQAGGYGGSWGGHGGDEHNNFRGRNVPPVPEETKQYLVEIMAHYKTLIDEEERGILAGNVLEEVVGKERRIAMDQGCSRHLETLLSHAPAAQILAFLGCLFKSSVDEGEDAGTLRGVITSPFGSHVIEKAIVRLEKFSAEMSEDELDKFKELLTTLNATLCGDLFTFACDRYATHVARRLLCVAAGRDVLPPTGKKVERGEGGKKLKGKTQSSLANKMGPGAEAAGSKGVAAALGAEFLDEAPATRYPELIQAMVEVLVHIDMQGPNMLELVYHQSAAPFLQAVLKAVSSDRPSVLRLTPCVLGTTVISDSPKAGKVVEFVKADTVLEMAKDTTASHVVEAVMQVAPPALFEELFTRFFKGHLSDLSHHASANFVVQATISATRTGPQVKMVYEELHSQIGRLMLMRRSGVVAALVAACGRQIVCQKEVCATLAAALSSQARWSKLAPSPTGAEAVLAPALLCLDSDANLGSNEAPPEGGHYGGGGAQRLSALGALILINVLKFGQGSCRFFTDSVAALGRHDGVRVGRDPAGSRVLETFLEGSAPVKVKHRFLTNLAGGFGDVALTAAGCFVLDRCFSWADASIKETIVNELCVRQREMESLHWGPGLLQRIGVESFKRDPDQWRKHLDSSTKTMASYSQLFGASAPAAAATTVPATKDSKKKAKEDDKKAKEEEMKAKKKREKKKQDAEDAEAMPISMEEAKTDVDRSKANKEDEEKEKNEKKRKGAGLSDDVPAGTTHQDEGMDTVPAGNAGTTEGPDVVVKQAVAVTKPKKKGKKW